MSDTPDKCPRCGAVHRVGAEFKCGSYWAWKEGKRYIKQADPCRLREAQALLRRMLMYPTLTVGFHAAEIERVLGDTDALQS